MIGSYRIKIFAVNSINIIRTYCILDYNNHTACRKIGVLSNENSYAAVLRKLVAKI